MQIKLNSTRQLEYVTHDKQNVLDLMFTVNSNHIRSNGDVKLVDVIEELKILSEGHQHFR